MTDFFLTIISMILIIYYIFYYNKSILCTIAEAERMYYCILKC